MLTCKHQVKTCLSKTAISTNSLWMVCKVTWNNKAFHLIAHTNQKMYTISSIWHKNMHQHLFVTIIIWCKESSRKTQSYKEQFHLAYCHAKWRLLCLLSFKYFWNMWEKFLWTADCLVCRMFTFQCSLAQLYEQTNKSCVL